ncbi:MAG: GNAT family N-acetyltransferase [Pseudomonadota bacterium]
MKSSDLLIRQLLPGDAPAYRAFRLLALAAHPDAFTSDFEEEAQRPQSYTEARLAAAPREMLWGAFVGEQLAGMVGLSRETRVKNRHKAALVGLYVAAGYAGRGIGRALVDTVLGEAGGSGIERLVLTVTEGNRAACALYQRAGFITFGCEPDAIRVKGASFAKLHMGLQLTLAPEALSSAKAA